MLAFMISIIVAAVGTFAVAWVMTKFTEPIRLGFTLVTVPTIARYFGKVPPSESTSEQKRE